MNTVEPIRNSDTVHAIERYLYNKNEKYYIMFITGVYLGLRINEVLKLKIKDVRNRREKVFRQSKTGKECAVSYNNKLIRAFKTYCENRDDNEALIPNPHNHFKPISRQQAYRVLRDAGIHFGLENIGTHTLRKTCGYHYYKQTKDIATLQVWFNHTSMEETLRYIGVTRERVQKAMLDFKI